MTVGCRDDTVPGLWCYVEMIFVYFRLRDTK